MERTDEGQEKLDYVRLLRPVERDTHVRRGPARLMHGHGVQIKRREVMHRLFERTSTSPLESAFRAPRVAPSLNFTERSPSQFGWPRWVNELRSPDISHSEQS